jgi:ABC-2 type transport system ATP-binding protein
VPEDVRAERIEYFAEQFGMEKAVFSQRMTGYSHGMRQKTMIIATLVHDPKVWILDEPMVGLDPQSAFNLKRMMREHADKGNTVMFSTHVLEIAEKVCDRIMIIDSGKIIYTGTMESLRSGGEGADLENIFLKMTSEAEA